MAMEANHISAEEESLRLLKSQLSQVQAIRVDNEQKELLINKLRMQVNELSAFKSASANMKLQIEALEERAATREAEIKRRNDELSHREKS